MPLNTFKIAACPIPGALSSLTMSDPKHLWDTSYVATVPPMKVLPAFSISALLLSPFISSLLVDAQETRSIKVYKPGKHILSPELLPIDFSSFVDPACQGKLSDNAQFAMIVDPMGQPRNIIATRPGTSGLAPLAAEMQRIASRWDKKARLQSPSQSRLTFTSKVAFPPCRARMLDSLRWRNRHCRSGSVLHPTSNPKV